MKTNAPEKIYVVDTTFPDYVDFDGSLLTLKELMTMILNTLVLMPLLKRLSSS